MVGWLTSVFIYRNAGGETIEVKFNVQDEDEDFAQDFEEEDEESEEDASNTGLNFEVTISKGELGSMHARCLASGSGELLVRTVQHLPAGKSASDTDLYEGPRFDQLSDALQDGIVNYLEDKLIDAELCFFILAHSAQKEQKEYENWLNKLLVFTDSK